jgi:glycosyltransferase involved in cell wall biosynthesis
LTPSRTHLVLIPSYNSGPLLRETVGSALAAWRPVLVVIDGSTDGSGNGLEGDGLLVRQRSVNGGKGAAVFDGLIEAECAGFTHAVVMDADGQHDAACIQGFMAASLAQPEAMILGQPRFGADAPWARVHGRRISNALVALLTKDAIGDALFGFRVYPIRPLLEAMRQTRWMRRFDFDAEAAVRLTWLGVPTVKLPVPVRYLRREEGGVSHFRYGRDNMLLAWMHLRLTLHRLAKH